MFLRPRDAVLRSLNIPKKARVLAAGTAVAPGDAPRIDVVATMLGLHVSSWSTVLRWDQIETARWDEPVIDVVIREGDHLRLEQLRLDRSGGLPAAIHDRVRASVVTSEVRDVLEGYPATFVARRRTDDGSIYWNVLLERGAGEAHVQQAAQAHLNDLRDSLGI
jgi:hypothetical protein